MYQVFETSDLPAGVVNIVTGKPLYLRILFLLGIVPARWGNELSVPFFDFPLLDPEYYFLGGIV